MCLKNGCKGTTNFSIQRIIFGKKPVRSLRATYCNPGVAFLLNCRKPSLYNLIKKGLLIGITVYYVILKVLTAFDPKKRERV